MDMEARFRHFSNYYDDRFYGGKWANLAACLPIMHQVRDVAESVRQVGSTGDYN